MNDPISKALETELERASPGVAIAWPNSNFAPPKEFYQEAFMLLARPENPTMGDGHYRQRGYLQVKLKFPSNIGAGAARARAFELREHFHRGLSMTADGVTTTVEETPEIGSGSTEGDRYVLNVFVRFWADIFGA